MFNKVSSTGIGMTGTVTRPANTNTYDANDVIGTTVASVITLTADSTAVPEGCNFAILGASLRVDLNAVPASMGAFRLHLYSSAPTPIADEGAFNLIAADRDKYLGWIDFDVPTDLGDTLYISNDSITMKRKFASGSISIYGQLQTIGALVGASGTVFTIKLHAMQP